LYALNTTAIAYSRSEIFRLPGRRQ